MIKCPKFEECYSFYVVPNKLVIGNPLSTNEIREYTRNRFYWEYLKRNLLSKLKKEKYSIGFIRHKLRMRK